MRDAYTNPYLLLYRSITADQNPVLKPAVLQHVGERRIDCLQQGIGINTTPGALQVCRQLTDALETLKSQRAVLGVMRGKYADSKSHVPYSRGAE